jgi:5-methylcytosine-specific restriction endonuclease McrA
LHGRVSEETFGVKRWLNQVFYKTPEWRSFRRDILIRDNCCDLGIDGRDIYNYPIVHHLNPITPEDILTRNLNVLLNPENVITTTKRTHDAIHYGSELLLALDPAERKPNDTIPWR